MDLVPLLFDNGIHWKSGMKIAASRMMPEWLSELQRQLKILFVEDPMIHLIKDESFCESQRMLFGPEGWCYMFPRLLWWALRPTLEGTMQIRRLKGSLNGFWASFDFVFSAIPFVVPLLRAPVLISITYPSHHHQNEIKYVASWRYLWDH